MIVFKEKEFRDSQKRVNIISSILNKIDTSIGVELLKCIEFGDRDKNDLRHWLNKIETNGFKEVSKDLKKIDIELNQSLFFYGIHVNDEWLEKNINTQELKTRKTKFNIPENYIKFLKEKLINQGKYVNWIGSDKKDLSKFEHSNKDLIKIFKEIESFISKGGSLSDFFSLDQ